MSKRLEMTPEIEKQIRLSVGDDNLNVSNLAVFETRTLSTMPIKRKAGMFAGARPSIGTLQQMADLVNALGGAIHMQIMHDTGVLPVGRVFKGALYDMGNGDVELRTLFYIPTDKTQLVSDIENSVIDEVSVGLMNEHLYCSECNFDYLGEDSTIMNRLTLTCENDHVIGQDGVHVKMVGVAAWPELSLVNQGAAKDAKILSRAKQNMGQKTMERLAASNTPLESRLFIASLKMEEKTDIKPSKETFKMDKETLALFQGQAQEVAEGKVKLAAVEGENTTLKASVTDLTAKLDAANQEITTLKADPAKAEIAAKLAQAEEDKTKLSDAAAKLLPHVKAALVASGEVETDLDSMDLAAMLAKVEEKGYKLHQLVGTLPKTNGTKTDDKNTAEAEFAAHRQEAFKTIKRNN